MKTNKTQVKKSVKTSIKSSNVVKTKTPKKYIVRCNEAGVFYGEIVKKTGRSITMANVQKIFYWNGACAIEQIAMEGVKDKILTKLTVIIPKMVIENYIQCIPCTKDAIDNLNSIKIWKK